MDSKRRYDADDIGDDGADVVLHRLKRQKALSVSAYMLAWICALPPEMAAATMMLDEVHDGAYRPADSINTYVLGRIRDQNVVIACLPAMQYGTVKATTVMTHLIRTFDKIRMALMVGIGGAAPSHANDIRLGDVVVGTRVMSYDLPKVVQDGIERTEPPKQLRTEAGTLISSVRSRHDVDKGHNFQLILDARSKRYADYSHPDIPDRLFQPAYNHVTPKDESNYLDAQAFDSQTENPSTTMHHECYLCDDSRTVRRVARPSKVPRVHYGALASGNQVVKNAVVRDQYARELGVICFEMEAAGLMDLLPCIPIRGICDYSDTHKNKDWQKYASLAAASFARDMIEHLPINESIADIGASRDNQATILDTAPSSVAEATALDRRRALLESLNFDQIDHRKVNIKGAHNKTCQWFLLLSEYQQWLDYRESATHHGFLWIRGKPGVGKSTMMKFIYGHVRKMDQRGFIRTISFFFHARGALLERSILGMYRSLLFQILSAFPDLQAIFDDTDVVPRNQTGCPPLSVLKDMLQQAVLRLGQRCVTCYIDALDECDEQQVVEMVRFFEELAESATNQGIRLRVCFSSRHYPYIDIPAGLRLTLEDLEGHTGDLSKYVLATLQIKDRALLEELHGQLLEKSSGVFLWVVLFVDILNKENRRGRLALRKRLAEVPEGLTELFRDLIKRDTQNMQDFRLCVMWILSAARPLSSEEYYHAIWSGLAIENLIDKEPPQVRADDSEDCMKRCVINTSKGLAEITKGKQPRVQFINGMVRDFLIKDGGLYELWTDLGMDWESSSHELLKQCCSFYLSHAHSVDDHPEVWNSRLKELPLLGYAAQSILYHADGAADAFTQDGFLSTFATETWIQVHTATEIVKARRYNPKTSLIYILADRGCSRLTRQWLKANPTVAILGDECRTDDRYKHPFFAALASGHKDTISALLGSESTVVHNCDVAATLTTRKAFDSTHKGCSPLTWAAQQGLTGLVRWILESGVTQDAQDERGCTALYRAAGSGSFDVAQLLLDRGACVDGTNKHGKTPLICAVENGHLDLASVLLDHGANVDLADEAGITAMALAANQDDSKFMDLLLSYSGTLRSGKGSNLAAGVLEESQEYAGQQRLVIGVLEESQEDDGQQQLSRTPSPASSLSSVDIDRGWDEGSLISQVTTAFTPEQRVDIIARFSGAILESLRSDSDYSAASDSSRQHILPHLKSALKTFGEDTEAEANASGRTQAKARRLVLRLRSEIAGELQDKALVHDNPTESRRVSVTLPDRDPIQLSEKIQRWGITEPSLDAQERHQTEDTTFEQDSNSSGSAKSDASSEGSEGPAEAQDATVSYEGSVNPAEVLSYLTAQMSFKSLVRTTEKLFERYHSYKMELIRNRTLFALRQLSDDNDGTVSLLSAVINVDWDLRLFLKENYDAGVHQPLDRILAITGVIDNAQLCSVGEYIGWCWPQYKTQLLMALQDALKTSGDQPQSQSPFRCLQQAANFVTVDSALRKVTVQGSEDFIISITQQISWLIAVCQEKRDQLTYAYVGFFQAIQADSSGVPTFDADVKIEVISTKDSQSCWNAIVGPAVLVTGFRIPERSHNERGLEVSIPVMAALSETPQAVTFGGGFVFKSRCHALVPIEDLGSSIQWHLVDTYPEKLRWDHIDKACPTRLRGPVKGDLWNCRSFLGWCPQVLELLATAEFDYTSTRYSKAGKPPRWARLDKLSIGFSQWATATTEITLGKKDGFRSTRPDDYETLLSDARGTHVILHDTTRKRAFQTNAEELILHILLHRRRIEPPTAGPYNLDDLEVASADRQATSARTAMISNAERLYSIRTPLSSSAHREVRFKHEVKLLFSTVDGLWANTYAEANSPAKISFQIGPAISGWEYMDVMKNVKEIVPKSVDLKKSCGRWSEYSRDIKAVVLFGGDFGDILKPVAPVPCAHFMSLPGDECYLGVRVDTLQSLFDQQGSLDDQQKLTNSGLMLQGSNELFKACDAGTHAEGQQCSSQYVVRIVRQSTLKSAALLPLEKHGAMIIGEITKASFFPRVSYRAQVAERNMSGTGQKHQTLCSTHQNEGLTNTILQPDQVVVAGPSESRSAAG